MKPAALAGLLWGALSGHAHAGSPTMMLYPNSPVLLWSERPIFSGKNSYSSAPMDQSDIVSALTQVANRESNSDQWGILGEQRVAFEQAELLCVFLLPSLGSDELSQFAASGAKSFVQEAVQDATSSVVVPHTMRLLPLREVLVNPTVPAITHSELEAFISADGSWHSLLSDGKTDIVVVEIADVASLPEADAAIRATATALSKATQGLTDFALAGDDAVPVKLQNRRGRKLAMQEAAATGSVVCDAGFFIGYNTAGKAFCFSHYVNMTPELLTGIIFGFFFIFLAYVGLSVLHAIQTPTKYPLHGPPRGKEF